MHIVVVWEDIPAAAAEDSTAEDILAVDSADIRAVDSAEDTLAVDSAENILANSDLTQSIHRAWILAFGRNAVDLADGTDLQLVLAVVAYYQQ